MTAKEIADALVLNLNELEVGCNIYHETACGQSVYIRFDDANIGSVRISNHNQRDAYNYKYNIRTDYNQFGRWVKNGTKWSYTIGGCHWEKMVGLLCERADFVKNWTKQRTYFTPKFKKKSQ